MLSRRLYNEIGQEFRSKKQIIFYNKNYTDNLRDIKETLRTGEGKI